MTKISENGPAARLDAADRLPGARELRALSYDLLGGAESVVDVGCGAGRAVAELAGGASRPWASTATTG
jgi:SAM-dependent methyltransferase